MTWGELKKLAEASDWRDTQLITISSYHRGRGEVDVVGVHQKDDEIVFVISRAD